MRKVTWGLDDDARMLDVNRYVELNLPVGKRGEAAFCHAVSGSSSGKVVNMARKLINHYSQLIFKHEEG
jgi:hypothetical protein